MSPTQRRNRVRQMTQMLRKVTDAAICSRAAAEKQTQRTSTRPTLFRSAIALSSGRIIPLLHEQEESSGARRSC